jgi:hypothetical protein
MDAENGFRVSCLRSSNRSLKPAEEADLFTRNSGLALSLAPLHVLDAA